MTYNVTLSLASVNNHNVRGMMASVEQLGLRADWKTMYPHPLALTDEDGFHVRIQIRLPTDLDAAVLTLASAGAFGYRMALIGGISERLKDLDIDGIRDMIELEIPERAARLIAVLDRHSRRP